MFKEIGNITLHRTTNNADTNIYVGELDNKKVIMKYKVLPPNNIKLSDSINSELILKNNRFWQYNVSQLLKTDITLIYPTNSDDDKLINKDRILYDETYEEYITRVYPLIKNQDITWMKNIIENRNITNVQIIYRTIDFVLVPDIKWTIYTNVEDLHCLAILTNYNIKSLRDLNSTHLDLLRCIDNKCKIVLSLKYRIPKNIIRSYIHYHPSFWQLHVHFNLVNNKTCGSLSDYTYKIHDIINNIQLDPNYYQHVSLQVVKYKN